MPRIPIYEQQVVPSQGSPMPRAAVDNTGRGMQALGEGLDRVAQNVLRVQQRREEEDNRIWLMNAERQFREGMNTFEAEFRAKAAPGANGYTPAFMKAYDEQVDAAVKNAPNERVAKIYRARLGEVGLAYQTDALRYEAGERVRYRKQQMFTGIDTEAKLAMGKPAEAEQLLGERLAMIDSLEGVDPGDKAEMREYARKNVAWYSTIGAIESNPGGWKEGGSMWNLLTADEQVRAQKYAEQKREEADTQNAAAAFIGIAKSVVDGSDVAPDGYIDLPAAQAAAVAQAQASGLKLDPQKQFQLEGYVAQVVSYKERDKKRQDATNVSSLFDMLEQNGGDFQQVLAQHSAVVNSLPREDRVRVERYAGEVATGGLRATDWKLYTSLVDDPELLKNTNLAAVRDQLNRTEYVQLATLQTKLQQDTGAEQDLQTNKAVVDQMLADASVKNDGTKARFYSMLQGAIDAELAASGKPKLPQTRVKELAAGLLTEVVTSRGVLWDSTEPAFQIAVPPEERGKIEAALAAEKLPVNDYTVMNAYRRKLDAQNAQ